MILLDRCKNYILNQLNRLQGGFQDQLGCIMTSLALRECYTTLEKTHPPSVYATWTLGKLSTEFGTRAYSTNC
ncbi:hypothetical protein DPMN_134069 [Dreissena polymorpha]|uniref:Uncharacterized protein n=1 Tax=Dreissena polymorpha TaxID=45954 RepID=A0A9D4JFG8_DREPO|nr:hypothetical protein DPMN_134069 [Dreissena polymorpha]